MKVFITGSSSHLAQALLPRLCNDKDIERVSGLDIRPSRFHHPKFFPVIEDIRSRRLQARLLGHDALIHMAYVVLRGRMSEQTMRSVNVDGTLQLFSTAREVGISRLINLSSAAVYGSGTMLKEEAVFNPLPDFLYAAHKVDVERRLKKIAPHIIQLRPHIILGPCAQPLLKQLLRLPFYIKLADPQPRLQAVHESDVANAIMLALRTTGQGAFNLAPDDSLSFYDMMYLRRNFNIGITPELASTLVNLAWRLTGWGGETAWVQGANNSLTCDNGRAKTVLGWQPIYTTEQVIKSC
ncbi:MAG: NAD-dependent epimerase/dehydratase family protein [Gammaproteobacteria bacterium]|nr:NAD-dependent epimerase/dehydratase family protein [Gammaproteobacteria bacterium]